MFPFHCLSHVLILCSSPIVFLRGDEAKASVARCIGDDGLLLATMPWRRCTLVRRRCKATYADGERTFWHAAQGYDASGFKRCNESWDYSMSSAWITYHVVDYFLTER